MKHPSKKIEIQKHPSIEEIQTFSVQNNESWTISILSYIKNGELPSDPKKAKKVKKRVVRFTILNGVLYKRGFSQPYLKCVKLDEH